MQKNCIIIVNIVISAIFATTFSFCNDNNNDVKPALKGEKILYEPDLSAKSVQKHLLDTLTVTFRDDTLVDITLFSDEFILDIKYARKDNFMDTVLYPCAKCLLRYEVIKDLLKAQSAFKSLGYRIKLFDCYRPLSVQKIMWKKMPVVGLVADPSTGSRHNRGSAIDLTLTNSDGNELDMGSHHDDMSVKGRTFYKNLPEEVIQNRMMLRTVMESCKFKGINSEWWHFSHICGPKYKVEDIPFNCQN